MNIENIDKLVDDFSMNNNNHKKQCIAVTIHELEVFGDDMQIENINRIINEQSRFEKLTNQDEKNICVHMYKSIHDNKLYLIYSENKKIYQIKSVLLEDIVNIIRGKK